MVQYCSFGKEKRYYQGLQQSMLESFFHLITDLLLEADSNVKELCPDQKKNYSLGENYYNNLTIIFTVRDEGSVQRLHLIILCLRIRYGLQYLPSIKIVILVFYANNYWKAHWGVIICKTVLEFDKQSKSWPERISKKRILRKMS